MSQLGGGDHKENGNTEEHVTVFESQVLADLLMVTRMREVKDAVPC